MRHKIYVAALLATAHQVQCIALHLVQAGRHPPAVALARLGQGHAALAAAEQLHAQEVLQTGDLAADGALGDRQFAGGPGVALVAGGRLEGGQGGGGGQFAAHALASVKATHHLPTAVPEYPEEPQRQQRQEKHLKSQCTSQTDQGIGHHFQPISFASAL